MAMLRLERLTPQEVDLTLVQTHSTDQLYEKASKLGHKPQSVAHALAVLHVVGKVQTQELSRWLQKTYVSSVRHSLSRNGPTPREQRALVEGAYAHAVEQWKHIREAITDFKQSLKSKPKTCGKPQK